MLYDRVPVEGVLGAIDSTFSGDAPCEKCVTLDEAKAAKEKREKESFWSNDKDLLKHYIPNELTQIKVVKPLFQLRIYKSLSISPHYSLPSLVSTPPPDSFA